MPRPRSLLALAAAAVLAVPAVSAAPAGATDRHPPALIEVAAPNHFPEAVDWDARHSRFVVGSASLGTISTVALDGTISPLVPTPGSARR
jgi:hypothetical protein